MVLKSAKKHGFPNTVHILVLVDKASKSKLQFNLRCQAKPQLLQQLEWRTPELQNAKGENELRFLATKVANKQIQSNLKCVEGVFSWKTPQPIEKEEPKKPEPPKVEQPKPVPKPEVKEPEKIESPPIKETNFFDDDDDADMVPADDKSKKPAEVGPSSKTVKEMRETEAEKGDFLEVSEPKGGFDDLEDFDAGIQPEAMKVEEKPKVPVPKRALSGLERWVVLSKTAIMIRRILAKKWHKASPKIIHQEFYLLDDPEFKVYFTATIVDDENLLISATDVTNNRPIKPIVVKKADFNPELYCIDAETLEVYIGSPEEEVQEEHNKSVLTNQSASSIVSRRSCIFEDKTYTISAHKYPESNKVKLRLLPTGGKEVKDEVEIDHADAEDEEQLTKMARQDLKSYMLSADRDKGVKLIPQLRLDALGFSNPEHIIQMFASFIKSRPQPVYVQKLNDEYSWYLIPEDDNKLRIHLVNVSNASQAEFIDFYCTNEDAAQRRTDEEYATIVDRFFVNWDAEHPHIEEKTGDANGSEMAEEEEVAEGEEEEDDLDFGKKKPKYTILVERTATDRNVVEVTSVRISDQEEVDKVQLKCNYVEDGDIDTNQRNIDFIKKAWTADQNTGKLVEKNNRDNDEADDGYHLLPDGGNSTRRQVYEIMNSEDMTVSGIGSSLFDALMTTSLSSQQYSYKVDWPDEGRSVPLCEDDEQQASRPLEAGRRRRGRQEEGPSPASGHQAQEDQPRLG